MAKNRNLQVVNEDFEPFFNAEFESRRSFSMAC